MRVHTLFALVIGLAAASTLVAQPHGTNLLASDAQGNLIRIQSSTSISTVANVSAGARMWGLAVDTDNLHVVGALDSGGAGAVVRIDPVNGAVTTVVSTARCYGIVVDQDGHYVVSTQQPSGANVFRVTRDGSAITTLASGFRFLPTFLRDRNTGDWFLSAQSNQILRYTPDFAKVVTTISHTAFWSYEMAQDPHRAAIYVGANNLAILDPNGNSMTTLTASLATIHGDRGLTVDRAAAPDGSMVYLSTSTQTGALVHRYDRKGTHVGVVASLPQHVSGLVFDRSRNLQTLLKYAPNDRAIEISFPRGGGSPFVLALSVSGYTPGVPLPDGRHIPLNPDPLTVLTAKQALPPLLVNNIGLLSASGTATVDLNANVLGGAVRGLRVWAVALTLNPKAPLGIGEISAPILILL